MTREEILGAMKVEKNFKRLGCLLEIYALEAFAGNEFRADDLPMKNLMDMLTNHVLNDYYLNKGEKDERWYIRTGNKAHLSYVYCILKDWFPKPDMGNVLNLGEKMHYGSLQTGKSTDGIDEKGIRRILTVLDEKHRYTKTVFGATIPIFLVMDAVPACQNEWSLRSGCEQTHDGFIFWKRSGSSLPVPPETVFLLNLADRLVMKALIMNKQITCGRIASKLAAIGYGWILEEDELKLLKHLADLSCIGLVSDTPICKYMPFSGQSAEFRNICSEIVSDLLHIAGAEDPLRSTAFF
jgi:hypothetical protein